MTNVPDPTVGDMTEDLLAILAHSMLNSLSVIHGSGAVLHARFGQLGDDQVFEMLDAIIEQADFVSGVFTDLVRSGSAELVRALDDLVGGN